MRDFAVFGSYVSMVSLTLREVVWPLFHSKLMFSVPWYVFPWWLSLGLFSWLFPFLLLLWLVSVVFCFVVVASLVCLVGRACPCPPLLVGLLLCLVLLVVLVFLVFSCGCPPLWPPLPLAFGGADQWF